MKGCLTYQNGPSQGTRKNFFSNAEALEIREGQCHISCSFVGNAAKIKVLAGVVMLGAAGKHHRVSGEVELRAGDQISLQETILLFTVEQGETPAPVAAPPKPVDGLFVSRRPGRAAQAQEDASAPASASASASASARQTPARGTPVVIASSRKPAADASASETPAPARWLFGFLAPEKQKNAYYQFLFVLFLLLCSFAIGAVAGSQTTIREKPDAQLEPYIREALYFRARMMGWDYPTLLRELQKAKDDTDRPLAVWWLTLPKEKP